MDYLCFIDSATSSVPHMEPLNVDTLAAAETAARRLLLEHRSGRVAYIFRGDERVLTIWPKR